MTDEGSIPFKERHEKYQALVAENRLLKEEVGTLNARLNGVEPLIQRYQCSVQESEPENIIQHSATESSFTSISSSSESAEKIRLLMSLFKGRDDVYARKWDSKKKESSGYSPVCLNEWKQGLCGKPKVACSKCGNKSYAPLDERAVDSHLRGIMVAGIYTRILKIHRKKITCR